MTEMTTRQLLTRLGRMTIHAKLWAFERAIAEYMEACTTVDEVTEYYNVYLRVHNRLGIEPHQVERSLSSFLTHLVSGAVTQVALGKTSGLTAPTSPKQGKSRSPRRRLMIE